MFRSPGSQLLTGGNRWPEDPRMSDEVQPVAVDMNKLGELLDNANARDARADLDHAVKTIEEMTGPLILRGQLDYAYAIARVLGGRFAWASDKQKWAYRANASSLWVQCESESVIGWVARCMARLCEVQHKRSHGSGPHEWLMDIRSVREMEWILRSLLAMRMKA